MKAPSIVEGDEMCVMLTKGGLAYRGCNGVEQYYYDRSVTQLLGAWRETMSERQKPEGASSRRVEKRNRRRGIEEILWR
jgi:hypothetical protein